MHLLTVIIVSWKVRNLLRDCLASLYAKTVLPDDMMEVIVVDNASCDGTVEMVRTEFPQVRLIECDENLGFGRANTLAFDRSSSEFVLLLNPDTLITEHAVERFLLHVKNRPDVAVAGCRLSNADGSLQRWTGGSFPTLGNVAAHYLLPPGLLAWIGFDRSVYLVRDVETDRDVDWVTGACMMLRRAWVPSPLFDPDYWMYGEDIDLCYRIKANGGRVIYTPIVTIMHYQGASIRQQAGDILLTSVKGMRQFYARYAGARRATLLDAVTVVGFSLRWAMYGLKASLWGDASNAEKARLSAQNAKLALRVMRDGLGATFGLNA